MPDDLHGLLHPEGFVLQPSYWTQSGIDRVGLTQDFMDLYLSVKLESVHPDSAYNMRTSGRGVGDVFGLQCPIEIPFRNNVFGHFTRNGVTAEIYIRPYVAIAMLKI